MRKERSYLFPGNPFVRAFLTASGSSRITFGDGDDRESDCVISGNAIGHCTDTLRSAGSSNFFRATPSLPLIERKILRAKYQKAPMAD